MNHADADFVVAIKAAKTSEDVLRAVAKRANPNKPPPTPEDLAAWWHECSDVARTEANKRLRLLARAMEPDAPDDVIDACAFGPAKPGEMPGDESAGLLGRLPVRVRPLRSMFVVDRVSVSATVTYKGGNRAEPGARDEPATPEPATGTGTGARNAGKDRHSDVRPPRAFAGMARYARPRRLSEAPPGPHRASVDRTAHGGQERPPDRYAGAQAAAGERPPDPDAATGAALPRNAGRGGGGRGAACIPLADLRAGRNA